MKLELQEQGLQAYEQARAFEQLRRRRVPFFYLLTTLFFIFAGVIAWKWSRNVVAEDFVATGVIVGVCSWWNWHRLQNLYARNLVTLADLEARYGEDAPWLKVERHLAAMEKLNEELAAEQRTGE